MKPHEICIEASKKRCHCIIDFIEELPNRAEIESILKGFGVSEMLGQRYKLTDALDKRING